MKRLVIRKLDIIDDTEESEDVLNELIEQGYSITTSHYDEDDGNLYVIMELKPTQEPPSGNPSEELEDVIME